MFSDKMFHIWRISSRIMSNAIEQTALCLQWQSRPLSTLLQLRPRTVTNLTTTNGSSQLLSPSLCSILPVQTYKVKVSLKRRCPSCYYVQRGNRLFVECHDKPRHKQMQKISKRKLFRED